jgi:hypothetical protein
MSSEYAILLLFAAVNIAAPFYRPALTYNVIVYLASLVLLYTAFLFWGTLCSISTFIYCLVSIFFFRRKLHVLYLTFANLFLCHVVIDHTLGDRGELTIPMLLSPDIYENVMSMISDTASIAYAFMIIGAPIFLIIKLFTYFYRGRVRR